MSSKKAFFILFFVLLFQNLKADATREVVNQLMNSLNQSNPQSLEDLWKVTDAAIAGVSVWRPEVGVVALTARNFLKNKYDPDSEEVKAIKLLGTLSVTIYSNLSTEIQTATSHLSYLMISGLYDSLVTIHIPVLQQLIKTFKMNIIPYSSFSRICKGEDNPFKVINSLYVLFVSNCNGTKLMQEKTDTTTKSYEIANNFFNWLEKEAPGIKTTIYYDYKNRLIIALSTKSTDTTEDILQNLKNDILDDDSFYNSLNIISNVAIKLSRVTIGVCIPHEITVAANYQFGLVSTAFAKVFKELIIVELAAIICLDEYADGAAEFRDEIRSDVQNKLKSIAIESRVYTFKLLNDFIVYETLIMELKKYLKKVYEFPIPVSKYNETAVLIRTYLEKRGYDKVFYQVLIVENENYGRDLEQFCSDHITKPCYLIWNYKTTHIFINRYNTTDTTTPERAENATRYINSNLNKILKVIDDNYDEVLVKDLYDKLQKAVPDIISDKLYTGLVILSEWNSPFSNFMQYGNATNEVTANRYYYVLETHTRSGVKLFIHRLIWFL